MRSSINGDDENHDSDSDVNSVRLTNLAVGACVGVALGGRRVAAHCRRRRRRPPRRRRSSRPRSQLVISGEPGTPPRYAVPDFVALSPDAADIAKTLGQVLWDDLNFEREFYMIPRDTYATIPAARTAGQMCRSPRGASSAPTPSCSAPCSRPSEHGARRRCGCSTCARGSRCSPRSTPAPRQLRGSTRTRSRTRSTSSSARCAASRARSWRSPPIATARSVAGPVEKRDVKEVYIADYDGENQRRVTTNRQLNIMPVWSPDGARDRLHVVSPRLSRHLHRADLPGAAGDADQRRRHRTGCRCSRRTGRGSASCRIATAIPSST